MDSMEIETMFSGSSASESLESGESGLGDSKENVLQSSLLRKAIIHWTDLKKALLEMEEAHTELEIAKRGNLKALYLLQLILILILIYTFLLQPLVLASQTWTTPSVC